MTSLPARLALGVLTGALALAAMLRLVAGAFTEAMSTFALVVTLVAMVPWLVYVTWRARRSRFTARSALLALGLDVVGLALVWVLVFGPVLALALSFAAFVVVWLGDRPVRRGPVVERYVRVEELHEPDLADREDAEGTAEESRSDDAGHEPWR